MIAVLGWLLYDAKIKSQESVHWASHTLEVIKSIGIANENLNEAEIAQRSFMFSGRAPLLSERDQALIRLDKESGNLQKLTFDNPDQQLRIAQLRVLIAARVDVMQQTSQKRQIEGIEAVYNTYKTGGIVQRLRAQIFALVEQIQQNELHLLQLKIYGSKNRYESSLVGLIVAVLVSMIVLSYLGFSARSRREVHTSQYSRSLIEASLDPLVTISAEGKITDVNEGSIKVTGLARDKLIGTDFSDYFTEPGKAREGYEEAFAKGLVTDYPLTIRHKDGNLTDVLYNASVYKDAQGNVLGVFAAARDVTARKQAENKFRTLFEAVPDALVVVNRGGEIVLINSHTELAFGYARNELLGRQLVSLIPERFRGRHGEHFSGYFNDPSTRPMGVNRSLSALHKDGSEFPVEISLSSLDTEDGRLVSAAIRDVTDQKQASAYARSLIEASLDPLVTIDAEGKITDVNEGSIKATGVAREKLIGTDFSDYFTEPAKAREGYQKVFALGSVIDYPLTIRHRDGHLTDVLYNASVYKSPIGTVLGVFAAARDITARKLVEADQRRLDQALRLTNLELHAAKIEADRANLAKSDFLSRMSHELRSPLNAILGFAQLIDTDVQAPTPKQKASLDQILQAGWYLLDLINEILDLALIESGKLSMSIEPMSLEEVLRDCEAMIEPHARKSGISVNFSYPERPLFIKAERTRVKQIIVNLLSNAIKYNRVDGKVEVSWQLRPDGQVRVSVQDTGKGLSPDNLAQLFQSFNRLGQETGVEQGTGIGLVVSKKLVELMGGLIGVESTVGVGSVFWIELKVTEAIELDYVALARTAATALVTASGMPQRTVLYVEDNPANLMLITDLLARRPEICMLSAMDGRSGVELAQAALPDVILMDINLPGISGVTALRMLAADPATAHIPVIAISANAMPGDIKTGLNAGFFRYLTKPIKVNEFMETLNLALEVASSRSKMAT